MRETGAVFGGEVSGHYYFRDFSRADSGIIPCLLMLEYLSKQGKPLSEVLRPFREHYFITGELNTPRLGCRRKSSRSSKEHFSSQGKVSHLDGLSVDAATGTSTSARRTPSRCFASTSKRSLPS